MASSTVVHFGPFKFDWVRLTLDCNGQPVPIGGRGAAILATLAKAEGKVVTRSELLDAVWPGLIVEERNITVQVAILRKILGELSGGQVAISTVARVGYSLACENPDLVLGTISALRPSVIVLPFANLSADPDLAFFALGVTEDIIAALSRFRTFAVFARSAFLGSGTQREAVALPDVTYVVEGSVRRDGHRLRVGAQLSNAERQVVWADHFQGELGDLFEFQDRIVTFVVSMVAPTITRAEVVRSRRKHPENMDAYDHFIQGLACYHGTSAPYGRLHRMVHHFDRAVGLDPTFPQALAYAGMAHEWQSTLDLAADPTDDFSAAVDLCDRAEALADDDALVLSIAAVMRHGIRNDGEGAVALARRSVALNPHSHDVLDFAATVHMLRDRSDEARQMFLRCLQLAPGSPQSASLISSIAFCMLDNSRFADAVDWETRAQVLHPNQDFGLVTLIAALAMDGRANEARNNLRRFTAARPGATIERLLQSLPQGARPAFKRAWSEGLQRAGMPTA